jgi:hypothetical protein
MPTTPDALAAPAARAGLPVFARAAAVIGRVAPSTRALS